MPEVVERDPDVTPLGRGAPVRLSRFPLDEATSAGVA
jgi:hypothetical protein